MPDIPANIALVEQQICAAASACGRPREDILLVAVSKTKPAQLVRGAFAAGLVHFGESYAQEAADKMTLLADLPICWHFVGPIQSNKTRLIAERFQWVHSVDRLKVAERLDRQRPEHLPPLEVLLQVNISGESSKSGLPPEQTLELARAVLTLPRLRLRGLMTVPAPATDPIAQRRPFAHLRDLLNDLRRALAPHAADLDQLSMGMTADLAAAIAEGATMVRVGTAIFGARDG